MYIARCHDIQDSGDPDWICWRPAWANTHDNSIPMGWVKEKTREVTSSNEIKWNVKCYGIKSRVETVQSKQNIRWVPVELINSAPPAPHEWLAPWPRATSPKPPTLRRQAPKNTKNPSLSFLDGIRVAQEHSPPPVLRVPKIGKKHRFDTFFRRFLAFRH